MVIHLRITAHKLHMMMALISANQTTSYCLGFFFYRGKFIDYKEIRIFPNGTLRRKYVDAALGRKLYTLISI